MNAKKNDKIATIILYIIAGLVILLLISIIGYILYKGVPYLSLKFLFGKPSLNAGGGIGLQLFNSFYMLIISLVITVPVGIGAGIYLAEYAKEGKVLNSIRLCIETMASLPSIVVGLFGLLFFVGTLGWGYSIIAGALSIAIINLPSMTTVTENALRSIPKKIKEASLGLGATKWQTIKKVILPSAIPQILTGIILASGRIFGEAAALLYTAGMSAPSVKISDGSAFDLFRPAETLAVYIWKLNSEAIVPDSTKIANASAAVLIIMVILFNTLARIIGKKIHERYTGSR
ncbi:phosphate ABC transporter permease PstA [Clostridium botulinum]|uniref:Phosphate transport system permease protein PstA n=1 Tax=Clostridium botulinum TaxID=1491 RepID=A0A9Q1UZF4_CLOBO|nr:phosphate ABC transporter permease PstA [Clostridium botulinum]AEB76196.1 phosphate ABC transporter, inner membrane subunit PstA [Clostridium botulinum BKT015925]KEI04932.1 phosphate ABC transporter permease [Clostridium botulinum C/D str. Sp77]KLU77103.1 phosphate ABC transporter permease [Clostridium botulinum V891]KOA76048.1 phosphate ABC transporter permease [Clostridium botulinum]KOA77463.1 phosphate ABC transporter permease [Clostridium botulinum]